MRLIFITGFGEDEFIFDHLHPRLPGEKEFVSLWTLLPREDAPALNVTVVAKDLVNRYGITPQDIVIGHSAGGWAAVHVKQLVHCTAVQIASWTDVQKVPKLLPVSDRQLFRLVKKPWFFNRPVLWWLLNTGYRNQPSAALFRRIYLRLREGNPDNRANQLRMIFNPPEKELTVTPDLRIHARKDAVVRFPDEDTVEVPGDHFSLYTYPDKVANPILQLLNTLAPS